MHQRRPRDGRTEEDDLHNGFFEGCARAGAWPDALVFSVGSHEAGRMRTCTCTCTCMYIPASRTCTRTRTCMHIPGARMGQGPAARLRPRPPAARHARAALVAARPAGLQRAATLVQATVPLAAARLDHRGAGGAQSLDPDLLRASSRADAPDLCSLARPAARPRPPARGLLPDDRRPTHGSRRPLPRPGAFPRQRPATPALP